MPLDADAIMGSLELVAERGVDPTPLVYARLFRAHPEAEPLFVLGPAARGHMLDEAFRLILDYLAGDAYASALLRSERSNHADLGVEPTVFVTFFGHIAGALKDIGGAAWTDRMEAAWDELGAALARAAAPLTPDAPSVALLSPETGPRSPPP